jgi:hypothetical protein
MFKCVHCNSSLNTRDSLNKHYTLVHRIIVCQLCNKQLVNNSDNEIHLHHIGTDEYRKNVKKRDRKSVNRSIEVFIMFIINKNIKVKIRIQLIFHK